MKKVTKEFLEYLHGTMDYWNTTAKKVNLSTEEVTRGLIGSILTYFDGMTGFSGGVILTDTDGKVINPDDGREMLHDMWYEELNSKKKSKEIKK